MLIMNGFVIQWSVYGPFPQFTRVHIIKQRISHDLTDRLYYCHRQARPSTIVSNKQKTKTKDKKNSRIRLLSSLQIRVLYFIYIPVHLRLEKTLKLVFKSVFQQSVHVEFKSRSLLHYLYVQYFCFRSLFYNAPYSQITTCNIKLETVISPILGHLKNNLASLLYLLEFQSCMNVRIINNKCVALWYQNTQDLCML